MACALGFILGACSRRGRMAPTVTGVSLGVSTPARARARTTSARSRRPASNCLPGSVRATNRKVTASTSMLSTPISGGRIQQQLPQQLVVARMLARLAQHVVDHAEVSAGRHGMSTTARAQSLDRFTVLTI